MNIFQLDVRFTAMHRSMRANTIEAIINSVTIFWREGHVATKTRKHKHRTEAFGRCRNARRCVYSFIDTVHRLNSTLYYSSTIMYRFALSSPLCSTQPLIALHKHTHTYTILKQLLRRIIRLRSLNYCNPQVNT